MVFWTGKAQAILPLLVMTGAWLSAPAVVPAAESTRIPSEVPGQAEARPFQPAAGEEPLAPVSRVDLNRYAGLWHEIARIPNRFQRQCLRDSLAVYSLRSDGSIAVLNQCFKRNGAVDQARGVARVVDPLSQARLKVSLVSVLGWRPFWGDYWIIGLDPYYRWAIVGEPRRRFGWILSRSRSLDPSSLERINGILERSGYTVRQFQFAAVSPRL